MNVKKVFFFLFVFVTVMFADNSSIFSISALNALNTKTSVKQKEIKTYKDYQDFKNSLIRLSAIEPGRAFFILGTLYLKKFTFKNKTIYPNVNKALGYFYKSLGNGNNLAAYYIALLETSKGDIYQALNVLQNTLDNMNYADNVYTLLSIEYSAIVLNYLRNDTNTINKAIKYMSKVNANNDVAAYLFANLLYFSSPDNLKKASEVLNYVCTNTKNKEIKRMCKTNPYIKGNKVPITCPFLKKQER